MKLGNLQKTIGAMCIAALSICSVFLGSSASDAVVDTSSTAPVPFLWLDATNPNSYPGNGSTWFDLSPIGRDGTIVGGVTYDPVAKAFQFPGGLNGQGGYVSLDADMNSFTNGLTIEFEGEFGAVRSPWERIFDFALDLDNRPGGIQNIANAVWVGQFENFNELAFEIFRNGSSAGYCYTATNGTALGALNDRSFKKWVITLDGTAPYNCRIYRDGVELRTRVSTYNLRNLSPTGANENGSPYALPVATTRPSSFVGRSNFSADRDLEGSIRYLRIYDQDLTPSEVVDNASATVSFNANGGSGSMAPQTSVSSTTLTSNTFERYGYTFSGWNTEQNGNGIPYSNGDTFPFSSDTTLYAQWQVDPNAPTTTIAPSTTVTSGIVTTSTSAVDVSDGVSASGNKKNQSLPGTGSIPIGWAMWAVLIVAMGATVLRSRTRAQ